MNATWQIVLLLVALVLLAAVAYWQLVAAEGAYLGKRAVALLYDWFAPRYDKVKGFDPAFEAIYLAVPVMAHNPAARVLDVGAGTGRLAIALFAQPAFGGTVTLLDGSAGMLDVARKNLAAFAARCTFCHHHAETLPFENGTFDVIACLEALEFFGDQTQALSEMRRVLKPGGLLIISNRIGRGARALPGRTCTTARFTSQLHALGFLQVHSEPWLEDYDLVKAFNLR
jgi:ubiquinone/menaquinone biosynthesis C-methylase UbiE